MTLPQVNLDDRRFQELVNEARQRISQACPEWTEHNVSDPGITLIEQFAWIADMLLYRLNRIPDKLHVALLDLLDIRLHGPTSARTELRFRLAAPPERPLEIPAGTTEVGTLRTAAEESVVFQVSEGYTIEPLVPSAYAIKRGAEVKLIPVGDGSARPQGTDRLPFGRPPSPTMPCCSVLTPTSAAWSCASRSMVRWPAAPESTPRTHPCSGRSARAITAGRRPSCSSTAPADSTTGQG